MATQIIPKKSTVPGKVPASADLDPGAISINHHDRRLYARHPGTGAVYLLAESPNPRVEFFDVAGDFLYFGKLALSDFPQSGSIFDSPLWDIARTTTDANGNVLAEASATGQWSNKQNLTFA